MRETFLCPIAYFCDYGKAYLEDNPNKYDELIENETISGQAYCTCRALKTINPECKCFWIDLRNELSVKSSERQMKLR